MPPTAEEKIVQGLQGFAEALEKGEDITKQFTCRKVVLDLEPTPYNSDLVKETRGILGMSQALFAQFLGVSTKCVQKWEQGKNHPEHIACRFMDEIRRNPKYWRERLLQTARPKVSSGC